MDYFLLLQVLLVCLCSDEMCFLAAGSDLPSLPWDLEQMGSTAGEKSSGDHLLLWYRIMFELVSLSMTVMHRTTTCCALNAPRSEHAVRISMFGLLQGPMLVR